MSDLDWRRYATYPRYRRPTPGKEPRETIERHDPYRLGGPDPGPREVCGERDHTTEECQRCDCWDSHAIADVTEASCGCECHRVREKGNGI